MDHKITDVKEQVRSIAEGFGVDIDVAEQIAQKCYDEVYWRPYGGATSFAEIDQSEATRLYSYKVDDETSKLRAIIDNVTRVPELQVSAKRAAITDAAAEYERRVTALSPEVEQKSLFKRFKSWLAGKEYSEDDDDEEDDDEDEKSLVSPSGGSVKVMWDEKAQAFRWLSISSNAFEDREKELFSTKALEEAIEYADKTGERGPLMFFHIPGTEIGTCDLQALAGRFLVESGTFDNTPLGNKALEYFSKSDEEWQVSIGYKYKDGDELDGTYDWLRFRERSILPEGTAANMYTSFKLIGDIEMNPIHQEALEKVFGKDMTADIISKAESKTKELEDSGVRFKSFDLEGFAKEYAERTGVDAEKAMAVAKKMAEETAVETSAAAEATETTSTAEAQAEPTEPVASEEKAAELATLLATLITEVSGLKETIAGIQTDVKALQEDDDAKIAEKIAPRYRPQNGNRPSESSDNVVDDEAIVKSIKDETKDAENLDPARAWALQLTGQKS